MRNFLLGAVTGVVLLFLCAALYLRLGFAEVRGDLGPSTSEERLMTAAVHASVRRRAPDLPNPIAPTDENLIMGAKLYVNNCSGCHGTADKEQDDSDVLFPPVPQFHKVGTEYSEAQIFWIAKHGIRRSGMFANGKWYPDKDLWTIAAYIKRARNLPPAVQRGLEQKK